MTFKETIKLDLPALREAMRKTGCDYSASAKILGMSKQTLLAKLKKYNHGVDKYFWIDD